MSFIRQHRRSIQNSLGGLAVLGMLAATAFTGYVPTSEQFITLAFSAGLIAVCTRFPIILRDVELSLSHAIGISVLFTFGLTPAAWTMAFGLLAGELLWFFSPPSAISPRRPSRLTPFWNHFIQQMAPLVIAGGLDRFLALQLVDSSARNLTTVAFFSFIFLVLYNLVLILELCDEVGKPTRFFRDEVRALFLCEVLPLPLMIFAAVESPVFGTFLPLIIGAVLAILAFWLYDESWTLLSQTHLLGEAQRRQEAAQQQVDQLQRQVTLVAAKAEIATRNAQALTKRARQFDTLVQLNSTLRTFTGTELPYESIVRQISEVVPAQIAQIGLLSSSGNSIQYVAAAGLSEDRAEKIAIQPGESGIGGRALRLGQPIRIGNVYTDLDYVEVVAGTRSEMCVPLIQGDRRLGVIRLLSTQAEAFDAEDEAFATQAGNIVALAMSNAKLQEQTLTQEKERNILFETGTKLTANLDWQTAQRTVVQKLAEAFDADVCHLAEVDSSGKTYRMLEPHSTRLQMVIDHPVMARVLTERRPVVVQAADTRTADLEERKTLRQEGKATVLILPLIHANHVMAIARLYSEEHRQYAPSDLNIALSLGGQAATALFNAQAFQKVIDSRDRLAAILDSTREGVLVIDANGVISLVNPRVQELWGLPVNNLLNQQVTVILDDARMGFAEKLGFKRDEIEELLLTLRAGLALPISKSQYPIQTPKLRYIERTGAPVLDQFARAIGWVFILRDITEERDLQQVRNTLANMIVHDLRSPLTAMLTGLSLIRDRVPTEQKTPLIQQSVDIAIRSTNKMIGLVNTLLDISRMETGEMSLNRSAVTVHPLVEEVLGDLMPLANDHGLVLINEVPPELPTLLADRDKLSRVFTNLVDNALKFSPAGGQVLVRAEVPTNGHAAPQIICSVLDSGPGIPPEYQDRVFDRFIQIEGQSGRRQGTGLGLTFCKMAVEAHGGNIWVERRPEGGSAFRFSLPFET
jgi:PAS domain S-box-containing protein